jgi:CRP-like cAMP-binding protein
MNAVNIKRITITKDTVICHDGDKSSDLYKVLSGTLLICKRNNRMVTPLAYLVEGQYFGEMSFFDNTSRSADVIATEDTILEKISQDKLETEFPDWLRTMAKSMTKRLRNMNELISNKGIKRAQGSIKPLSIDEQRRIYALLAPNS